MSMQRHTRPTIRKSTTADRPKFRSGIVPVRPVSLDGRPRPQGAARDLLIANIEALLARFESMAAKLQALEVELRSQSSAPK